MEYCDKVCSAKAAGLALPLQQAQNVAFSHTDRVKKAGLVPRVDQNREHWQKHLRSFNVADDATGGVVHELNTNLGNSTTVTGPAENVLDLGKLDLSGRRSSSVSLFTTKTS